MVHLEKMVEEHLSQVEELENKCFSDPWSMKMFIAELKNERSCYTVLLEDKKIIGYSGFWKILNEGHIMNIAVDPEFRGRNYSDILIKSMISEAVSMGINSMTLEVRKENLVAQNLYRKYGFKEVGIRKGYYSDNGEDAVIMWATISA